MMLSRISNSKAVVARGLLRGRRRLHTRLETFENPTAASLAAHFTQSPVKAGTVSAYLLSTTTPRVELEPLIITLHAHLPSSIGSFSLPLPNRSTPSITIATFTPEGSESIRTFQSDLESRPAAQVGKWQRDTLTAANDPSLGAAGRWTEDKKGSDVGEMERLMGGMDDGSPRDWSALWEAGRNERKSVDSLDLPEALWGMKPSDVSSLLLLTDSTPQALLNTVTSSFPDASLLGLVTPPTPFITSLPSTLFHQGKLQSKGGVGIAFTSKSEVVVAYDGYKPLSEALTIASAQGNLLLTINHANPNPTQALIRSIQARPGNASKQKGMAGLGKDEEFFMALLSPSGDTVKRVVKILSGDPSRGALSLEMEEPLLPGQRVQFMHRPDSSNVVNTPEHLSFVTLPKDDSFELPEEMSTSAKEMTVTPGFAGASEGGFIYSTAGHAGESSLCMVPGGHGRMIVSNA